MLTWILLLRCHYGFSDRTSVFSFLLISFLLSAILLPSFLLSFPCSFQLVSILPVVPCSLALRPSLLFRYPLQLSSLIYPISFYTDFPCVFFLPQYVYLASHYLSLYRVLWRFYAILYNRIRFITYYNATMATTTDTTIASATIATNTLAIYANAHEKRPQRAFQALLVSYTTHDQKCNTSDCGAFQSMCAQGGQVYAGEGQTYYGAQTVTHMQYIGCPLAN